MSHPTGMLLVILLRVGYVETSCNRDSVFSNYIKELLKELKIKKKEGWVYTNPVTKNNSNFPLTVFVKDPTVMVAVILPIPNINPVLIVAV